MLFKSFSNEAKRWGKKAAAMALEAKVASAEAMAAAAEAKLGISLVDWKSGSCINHKSWKGGMEYLESGWKIGYFRGIDIDVENPQTRWARNCRVRVRWAASSCWNSGFFFLLYPISSPPASQPFIHLHPVKRSYRHTLNHFHPPFNTTL